MYIDDVGPSDLINTPRFKPLKLTGCHNIRSRVFYRIVQNRPPFHILRISVKNGLGREFRQTGGRVVGRSVGTGALARALCRPGGILPPPAGWGVLCSGLGGMKF